MAATLERTEPRIVTSRGDWLFTPPLWVLVAAGLFVSVVLYGYKAVFHMPAVVGMAQHPFDNTLTPGNTYLYQSPLGPLTVHLLGLATWRGVMLVNFTTTAICLTGCAYIVRRQVSDVATRLFLVAFFCSPLSAMAVNHLGMWDCFTIVGATLLMCASAPVCLVAGLVMGFNHFDQSAIVVAIAAALRLAVRRDRWRPVAFGAAGVVVGKILLQIYLSATGLVVTDSRLELALRDPAELSHHWRRQIVVFVFSVYGVLWLALGAMWRNLSDEHRKALILLHVVATLPVLLTSDLTRVYAILTWPIAIFGVLYWSEYRDREFVQRWAKILLLAAMFVPRVNIIWSGQVIVSRWN